MDYQKIIHMVKSRLHRSLTLLLILCLTVSGIAVLAGCSDPVEKIDDPVPTEELAPEETEAFDGRFTLYYKNTDGTGLSEYEYKTGTLDSKELVTELISQLQKQVEDDPDVMPAVNRDLKLLSLDLSDSGIVNVDFSSEYLDMDITEEILCRAALALTLTQMPAVDYVNITVEMQPLLDERQNVIGRVSGSDFVTTLSGNLYNKQKSTIYLYFAAEDGEGLAMEERTVLFDNTMNMEELVMKILMEGPLDDSLQAVIPKTVSLLNVTVKSGICYVNFDDAFLADTVTMKPELVIYSIVDSLSELQSVTQVQITVNGASDVMFMDTLSLNQPFTANYEWVNED